MANCSPNTGTSLTNLPPSAPVNINIDCVPTTAGQPTFTPQPDQLPFAHDPVTGILWIHQCPNTWIPFNFALCSLPVAQITGIANPCGVINVPITYDRGAGCETGVVTLQDFSAEVANCLSLGTGGLIDIVPGSPNVTVTTAVVGGVTTYTVSVTGQTLSSVREIQQNGNLIAEHDDGSGTVRRIEETITTFIPDGNGGFNYTNETGGVTNIPGQTITTLTPDGNGGFNYQNESGAVVNIPGQTITTLTPDGSGGFNYTNEVGAVVNIPAPPTQTPETVTTLVPDGSGGFDYTNEAGVVTNIPGSAVSQTVTTLVQNINGGFDYTNEAGTVTTIPAETVTTLVPGIVGGFDYTNEAGVVVSMPPETVTTLVPNPTTGGYTYTSEDGTVTTVPGSVNSSVANQNTATPTKTVNQVAEHNDGGGLLTPVNETVTTLVQNATTGDYDFTNEVGTVSTIPGGQALTAGNGTTIVGGAINAIGGSNSVTVAPVTRTNVLTGVGVGGPITYNRVNPDKNVLVLINAGSDFLYDPQAAGFAGQTTDFKGEFQVFATVNTLQRTVTANRFDTNVRTISASGDEIFTDDSEGLHQEIVNANTVTVQLSIGNLTMLNGTTPINTGAGAIWGISSTGATVTFIEV